MDSFTLSRLASFSSIVLSSLDSIRLTFLSYIIIDFKLVLGIQVVIY